MKYIVLVEFLEGKYRTLGLTWRSFTECQQAIVWQKTGGYKGPWVIKSKNEVKEMLESGQIVNTFFTEDSWAEFCKID